MTALLRSHAQSTLGDCGLTEVASIADRVAVSADPPLALGALQRLLAAGDHHESGGAAALRQQLDASPSLRENLTAVLGASVALGDHLITRAATGHTDWSVLTEPDWLPDSAGSDRGAQSLSTSDVASLRATYRQRLLRITAADLRGTLPVMGVTTALSELADDTLGAALRIAEFVGDVASGETGAVSGTTATPALTVIALGKGGARELNYVSDLDVMFVVPDTDTASPAGSAAATSQAQRLMRICREVAWQVDAGLRPEGHHGALVRTIDSYLAYYRRWARNWEFQALLKARWAASTTAYTADTDDLAAQWEHQIAPMVWQAADRSGFVADAHAMLQRVRRHAGPKAAHDIKLGPGGLRDIEFAVQLLQLVHGRADVTLRAPGTVVALHALTQGGYVGRDDGAALSESYCFLRMIEHRLQLRGLRRTHRLPTAPDALNWLARSLGYHLRGVENCAAEPRERTPRGDPVELFLADWRRHGARVRQLHEKLFYRPLLTAVARLPSQTLRLSESAAAARLAALGFGDPAAALRHVAALSSGVSRRAAIQRSLLPVILAELADTAAPDAGLLAYRAVSDQLGRTPWFLRLMRDGNAVAPRLAKVLGSSRYLAELLQRDSQGLSLLASDTDLFPRTPGQLAELLSASAARVMADGRADATPSESQRAVDALRLRRAHELLRIATADVCGLLDVSEVAQALSDLTDAVIAASLEVVCRHVARRYEGTLPVNLAVIGMGRYGGGETGYASDADVMFVYQPRGDVPADTATAAAIAVVAPLLRLLSRPAAGPPLLLDADLRPEGRAGPLARSLAGFAHHYQERSAVWEALALLRARPVAGDASLGERFVELIAPVRYPVAGLNSDQVRELRRMKARVETERLPRGADPATHLKLGRGALTDVEWAVQLLALRHSHRYPGLRTPRTLQALGAARDVGLIAGVDHDALAASWLLASRIRNAVMLVRGTATDQLPSSGRDLAGTASLLLRRPVRDVGEFTDHYLQTTRRARQVIEKLQEAG